MIGKTQITRLASGCRVVTAEMPSVESVSIAFDAGTGGRFERAGERGFSHFLEHMLFKGSEKRRSTRAVSQPLEHRGGSMNAWTAAGHTCFFASAPFDAAGLAFDILGDMFARPLLPEKEIDKERRVVLEEMKMYHDDDASFVADLAQEALWPGHPLGRPILGTPESLAAADREALLAYHGRCYRAGATIVAAAGRIEHERAVGLAEKAAAALGGGPAPRCVPASRAKDPVPLVFEERETQQVQLVASFRAVSNSSPRKTALSVLSHVLGRGLTSRLFMALREKHGLAYSVGSEISLQPDCGALQIFAGIDPARAEKAAALCAGELRRIAEEPVGRAELGRAVGALVGALRMSGETSSSQMSWILERVRATGRVETPAEVMENLRAVTAEDVRSLARDVFLSGSASLALVVPRGGPAKPDAILRAMQLK